MPGDAQDVFAVASRSAWRSASSALACGVSCHWVLSASTMRCCSGQRKSGMTRRPSRCRGTLTSWRGETRRGEQVIDAVFQLGAGGGRLGGQDAREACSAGAPGGAVELAAQAAQVGQVHATARGSSARARARSVEPWRHVQQQPLRGGRGDAAVAPDVLGVQAAGAVHGDPVGAATCPCGTVTSGRRSSTGSSPNSIIKAEWLSSASGPQAFTAASHRPSGVRPVWPTA